MNRTLIVFLFLVILTGCSGQHSRQQDDELYSRHLQRRVKLTIIHTPVGSDRKKLNLLLMNDGQEIDKLAAREIIDSLYQKGSIEPLVLVAIHAGDRMQEYGVAGQPDFAGRGKRASYYDAFINDELYPYVKKKAGVRSFRQVVIGGCSLGGLSAMDIAWNHPDKIDRVGVFSGSFWWRDVDVTDSSYSDAANRILLARIRSSRKKPGLRFWFYAGGKEETSDRDGDGIIDVEDDTRDLIHILEQKNIPGAKTIVYREWPEGRHDWPWWRHEFPDFLLWAFPKK